MKDIFKKVIDSVIGRVSAILPSLTAAKTINVLPVHDEFSYQLPENFDDLPETVKRSYQVIVDSNPTLPTRHLYVYRDVLISYQGAVFKNLSLSVKSLCHPALVKEYSDSFLLKQWLVKPIHVPIGIKVAVVHDHNSTGNYYHWLIEACPRILLLRKEERNCLLLVPAPTPEYIITTAALLGYNNLFPIKQNEIIKAHTVLLAESVAEHKSFDLRHHDPELLQELRASILRGLNISTVTPFRRIYVSRARQKTRRLYNEDEFVKTIKKFGFEIVYFEHMSFKEQVYLMNETAILIGAHGANLANALFMQPTTTLIEIVNKDIINSVYFRLTSYLKISYHAIIGIPDTQNVSNNSNLFVDIKKMHIFFKKIMVNFRTVV